MSKTSTFLQRCFLSRRDVPKPGDQLDFLAIEKKWAEKTSFVEALRSSIAGETGEDGEPQRIDEPLRDLTIKTYYFLTHIANYYSGLFTPFSEKNKEFVKQIEEIWDVLIKNTIFGGVYVGHGEDLIELDRALIGNEDTDNAQLSCLFRLYTRSGKGEFYSIFAAKPLKEKSGKLDSRVVKFWIRESNYWLEWWHLLTEFFGGIERVKMLAKAAGVRTICSVDSGDENFTAEMETLLSGEYPVLKRKGTVQGTIENEGMSIENSYDPHEFVPVDAPRQLMDFYINYFDVFSDYLGYGGKASPHKMERLTEQEASQGSDVVATIQNFLQRRIQSCFDQMSKIYPNLIPEDFEVVVSNRATAQSILDPEEQEILKGEKPGNNANIDG